MDYKNEVSDPSSVFLDIKQVSEFKGKNNGELIPSNFFSTNLQTIHESIENFVCDNKNLINSLKQLESAFETNVALFEDLIINSDLISSLIQILTKIKDMFALNNSKDQSNFWPDQTKLIFIENHIFNLFKILSSASNPIIRLVLSDNSLFDHLVELDQTIKYTEQGKLYFLIFHLYFQKFSNISYTYTFPENSIYQISLVGSTDNVFHGNVMDSLMLTFFEDVIKNSNVSEKDMSYLLTAIIFGVGNFANFERFESACHILKLLFHKYYASVLEFIGEDPNYTYPLTMFSMKMHSLLKYNSKLKHEPVICSLIDELFKCVQDDKMKKDVMSKFEPELLYKTLKKSDAKHCDVSSLFNLISHHFTLKNLTTDTFASDGGYDLLYDFLNDCTFSSRLAILRLLCDISDLYGWPSMPEKSFSLFLENCFDILTVNDTEVAKIFYKGFYNALKVNDKVFHKKVMDIYNALNGMDQLLNDLLNNGSEEVRTLVYDILAIINDDKEVE